MNIIRCLDQRLDEALRKVDASVAYIFDKLSGDDSPENATTTKRHRRHLPSLLDYKRVVIRESPIFLLLLLLWLWFQLVGLSFSGLLLIFVMIAWRKYRNHTILLQNESLQHAYSVNRDTDRKEAERKEFISRLGDVPGWVFFADWERAEWLNTIIQRLWPYIKQFVAQFILTNFSEMLKQQTPLAFEFCKVDIGDEPLRIGSIRSYNVPNMARDEIVCDIEVLYCGDAEFKVNAKALRVGVANLKLRGTLRATLKPLRSTFPFVSCVTAAFISRPELDFTLTDFAEYAEKLGLRNILRDAVVAVIEMMMVLPNRWPIRMPMAGEVNEAYLKHPMPVGVLRVKVFEARDLPRMDLSIGNMAKCDGFCEIAVGKQVEKTRVIEDESNPKWNESFDFTIVEKNGQRVDIVVYDDDIGKKQYVGKLTLQSHDIASASGNTIDKWYHIYDTTRAKLHLQLTYFNLSDDAADLTDHSIRPTFARELLSTPHADERFNRDNISLVYLFIDAATNLPRTVRDSEPDARLSISVERNNMQTETVKGCNPRWNQVFHFLVDDPLEAVVVFEVKDRKHNRILACANVKLKHVSKEPHMTWTKPIRLEHKVTSNATETNLYATVALRAMTTRKVDATAVASATDRYFLESSPQTQSEANEPVVKPKTFVHQSFSTNTMATTRDAIRRASLSLTGSEGASLLTRNGEIESEGSLGAKGRSKVRFASMRQRLSPMLTFSQLTADRTRLKTVAALHDAAAASPAAPIKSIDNHLDPNDRGVNGLGRIKLTLRYAGQEAGLNVTVRKCLNLVLPDNGEEKLVASNPYVTVKLISSAAVTRKQRTAAAKGTLSPTFNEVLSFSLEQAEIETCLLLVLVKLKTNRSKIFGKSIKCGIVCLQLKNYLTTSQSLTAWFDLQAYEDVKKLVKNFK